MAIFPLLALLIFGVVKSRQLILDAAATRAVDLARLAAERQDDSFKDARDVLGVIRRLPQVTAREPGELRAAMQAIGADYPQFTSPGLVDADGIALAQHARLPRPFADHGYFSSAWPPARRRCRRQIHDRAVTGEPIVVIAAPLVTSEQDEPPPGIAYVAWS